LHFLDTAFPRSIDHLSFDRERSSAIVSSRYRSQLHLGEGCLFRGGRGFFTCLFIYLFVYLSRVRSRLALATNYNIEVCIFRSQRRKFHARDRILHSVASRILEKLARVKSRDTGTYGKYLFAFLFGIASRRGPAAANIKRPASACLRLCRSNRPADRRKQALATRIGTVNGPRGRDRRVVPAKKWIGRGIPR